jgi:hypothetical protein
MDGTGNRHGRDEKCIEKFVRKTGKEDTTQKILDVYGRIIL